MIRPLLACVVLVLCLANSTSLLRADEASASVCPPEAPLASQPSLPATASTPAPPALPSITVEPLGWGQACGVPQEARLILKTIRFASGAGQVPRTSKGTILYVVESGSVMFAHNQVSPTLGQGETLVVQKDDLYGFNNPSSATSDAVLLRLSLAPPNQEDGPIAVEREPVVDYVPTGNPEVASLFSADLPRLQGDELWLFLARLTWDDSQASSGWLRSPGPVGLKVERGNVTVTVGTVDRPLAAGGCVLIPADAPYRIVAVDGPPSMLFFGVLRSDEPTWQAADEAAATAGHSRGPLGVECPNA